jgi:hypothetical protein
LRSRTASNRVTGYGDDRTPHVAAAAPMPLRLTFATFAAHRQVIAALLKRGGED